MGLYGIKMRSPLCRCVKNKKLPKKLCFRRKTHAVFIYINTGIFVNTDTYTITEKEILDINANKTLQPNLSEQFNRSTES